jgi:hypothetical protein
LNKRAPEAAQANRLAILAFVVQTGGIPAVGKSPRHATGIALAVHQPADFVGHVAQGDLARCRIAPALLLGHAFGQAFVADHDAVWDADQVHVGEDHAWAFVAMRCLRGNVNEFNR